MIDLSIKSRLEIEKGFDRFSDLSLLSLLEIGQTLNKN